MTAITVAPKPADKVESPSIPRVSKGDLRKLFSDSKVVQKVSSTMGIARDAETGQPFCCILPGHEQSHPSATLRRNRHGVIVYRDSHLQGGLSVLTLPEVYFACATGEIRKLRGPTCAVWALRLLAKASVVRPVHIDSPELPMSASSNARKVFAGFKELLALKWTYETGAQPTPFSHRFAAAWCGVSEKTASDAIKELLHLKVMHIAGNMPGPFGKPMALFAPGPGHNNGGRIPAPILASHSRFGGNPNDN